MESTLTRNKAKYHQSCRLLFNNAKLKTAQIRDQNRVLEFDVDGAKDKGNGQDHVRRSRRSQIFYLICKDKIVTYSLREVKVMEVN